jgi:hypothetical protein
LEANCILLPTLLLHQEISGHEEGYSLLNISGDGEVFTWGRGTHGQLGHGNLDNVLHPKFVNFFQNHTVTFVSAGWNHSGFTTGLLILKLLISFCVPTLLFLFILELFELVAFLCIVLFLR